MIRVGHILSHPLVAIFSDTDQPTSQPTNQTADFTVKTSFSLLFRRRYPNSTTNSKTTACSARNQGLANPRVDPKIHHK